MNNPWVQFATSIALRLVTLAAGVLIASNILTPEQVEMVKNETVGAVATALIAVATIAYGIVRKWLQRRVQLKAQEIAGVTEAEVNYAIHKFGAPPVLTSPTSVPQTK